MEVYKYFSDKRTSILRDGCIRFTQPKFFNDPYEVKPVLQDLGDDPHTINALNVNFEQSLKEAYKKLPLEVQRKFSFTSLLNNDLLKAQLVPSVLSHMDQQTKHLTESFQTHFAEKIGILALSENPSNLLMWAHYANEHRGFTVGFDATNNFFDQKRSSVDQLRHLRKVKYLETRPRLIFSQINSIDDLMVKSADWAYEKEWRLLHPLDDADKVKGEVYLFRIPFSAFSSIRIGARASLDTKNKIHNLLQKNPDLAHVQVYELSLDDKNFGLIENIIK